MLTHPTTAVLGPAATDTSVPRPWRWSQHWRDLLFVHWSVPVGRLHSSVPAGLEIDTWSGEAWVSAVAFRLERVRLRWLPPFAPVSNFLELNLRTYVCWRGEPAIYFLSIHANSRLGVGLARLLTPLPYRFAPMRYDGADSVRQFRADHQTNASQPLFHARFQARAAAEEDVAVDSLDGWFLERYHAWTSGAHGQLYRMVARHPRWRVQGVTANVTAPRLGDAWGVDLERKPDRCHFSTGVKALIEPFESW